MQDEKSAQKTNDDVLQDLKNKSAELKKKHEETTMNVQQLNETLEKILEKRSDKESV